MRAAIAAEILDDPPRIHAREPAVEALAAADKLHDLEAVSRRKMGRFPPRARKNLEIVLDRDAAGVQSELLQQTNDVRASGGFPGFTIHLDEDLFRHGPFTPRVRESWPAGQSEAGVRRWPM